MSQYLQDCNRARGRRARDLVLPADWKIVGLFTIVEVQHAPLKLSVRCPCTDLQLIIPDADLLRFKNGDPVQAKDVEISANFI